MRPGNTQFPPEFVSAIDEALGLLTEHEKGQVATSLRPEPLPSLLDQCRDLLNKREQSDKDPIRTIHHFACTGGTLITKCLAAMPNTQVLSEVNPLSPQMAIAEDRFFPTDLIRLVRASTRGADDDLLIRIFLGGLSKLYEDARRRGVRLLLRDHAHSHFSFGESVSASPGLSEVISREFPIKSIVTVRHPLDSYLSLVNNGWRHFVPATIEEYARRYMAFLDRYDGSRVFRYEDFVANPGQVMREMCDAIALTFDEAFEDTFMAYRLSGDSGRKGGTVALRSRRPAPDEVWEELRDASEFKALCLRLGYNSDVVGS